MLRSANPDVREVPDGSDDDGDDYADKRWWTGRRKRVADRVERWLVPSARRWVRSALKQSGRLYADSETGAGGPANFTGYWPHTLLVRRYRNIPSG